MAIKAKRFSDARSQAKSNPELVWWVFMRLSGAFLVALSFFHLWKNYIVTDELSWDYEKVASSYANTWNQLYLLALLVLGLLHGANGLRYVIDDATAKNPVARFVVKAVMYTAIAAILTFGSLALFSRPHIPGT